MSTAPRLPRPTLVRSIALAALFGATLLALGGCAHRPTNAQVGTGVGAVAGGLVGNAVFGGTLGTVGGAAAGALIGNEIGRQHNPGPRRPPKKHHHHD